MKRILTIFLLAASLASWGADAIPWKLPSYTLVARDMDLRVALDTSYVIILENVCQALFEKIFISLNLPKNHAL